MASGAVAGDYGGADGSYLGDHERIPNVVLLTDVLVDFWSLVRDFRYQDSGSGESVFSEDYSLRVARREVGL